MSDPANADKILATLAERAAKRRSTIPLSKKPAPIKESVEIEHEHLNEEQEEVYTKQSVPDKVKENYEETNINEEDIQEVDYNEDYSDLEEEEDLEENEEEYIEPSRERRPHRMEKITKVNKKKHLNSSSRRSNNLNSNVNNRYYNKPLNRRSMYSPENCSSFEEQIDVVGNLLYEKLSAYQGVPALRLTQDWIDCIVDDNDSIYDDVYDKLISLNKEQLLGYIRILVSALK